MQKGLKAKLKEKLQVLTKIEVRPAFSTWKSYMISEKKLDSAVIYHNQRSSFAALQKTFTSLKIHYLYHKDMNLKASIISRN